MDLLTKILAQYDIPEITPQVLVRESGDNQVYVIGTNKKKILRLSKKLPIEDVRFEYEALQYLAKNNFPVPGWVKTKKGNFYASTEGIGVAVLFDFLEGYHVKIDKEHFPTKEQAFTAGSKLGEISNLGQIFKSSSSRHRNIFSELERVLQNEDVFKKKFEGGTVFVEQVKEIITFAKGQNILKGLIHNDYRVGNVFFKTDTVINGVIDFDWSCIGPNIKDLALGVIEWSFPDGSKVPNLEVFDTFLEGYNSAADNKVIKNKNLYTWIMFAALSDAATFFCDRLGNHNQKKNISYSYMYQKYLFSRSYYIHN
jgi:Ser/Thr protein kinase RdoA (MazF antagonist)